MLPWRDLDSRPVCEEPCPPVTSLRGDNIESSLSHDSLLVLITRASDRPANGCGPAHGQIRSREISTRAFIRSTPKGRGIVPRFAEEI